MKQAKPTIPKGTRDFGPVEMVRRNYIFDIIRTIFKKYGYDPIETPSMENLSTLLGKYGDEGDKLLFKVLNSGNAFSKVDFNDETIENPNALSFKICEKGLRYDLTVPFARFVVQHQSELTFPFKRYQIQPVWRADRPQKGRYREFYQCDCDVIGSHSLVNELEMVQIADEVFTKLDTRVCIKINNRKLLAGLAEVSGFPDKLVDITVAIDKIDKIGLEDVKTELIERGISKEGIDIIEPVLLIKGNTDEKLTIMRKVLANSEIGSKGLDELEELFSLITICGVKQKVEIDLSLARGLNYYTGAIFEVKALDFEIGSICGGGRYDDLTSIFGLPDMSGVGISFGADRIYDVMLGNNKFPTKTISGTKILFSNMGDKEMKYTLPLLKVLRQNGIAAEIYPSKVKFKKQFEYANKKNIPYFAIIGDTEIQSSTITIKELASSEQSEIKLEELITLLKDN
ncbi:MAG: histidine--tRNA ligase [Bacteroidales bacterium]